MSKIYIFICGLLVVYGAFWAGGRIATAKCAAKTTKNQILQVYKVLETKRHINEKSFNTGVDDIRHILHTKYTIAD